MILLAASETLRIADTKSSSLFFLGREEVPLSQQNIPERMQVLEAFSSKFRSFP
jgi:hypothetical protein